MKIEEKVIETKSTVYVCEVCGKESIYKNDIYDCEKKHKIDNCNHDVEFVLSDVYDEDSFVSYHGIRAFCPKCGGDIKEYEDIDFGIIIDNQEALKAVYEILKNAKDE